MKKNEYSRSDVEISPAPAIADPYRRPPARHTMAPTEVQKPPYMALLNPRVLALLLSSLFPFTTFFIFSTGLFTWLSIGLSFAGLFLTLFIFPGTNVRVSACLELVLGLTFAVLSGASTGQRKEHGLVRIVCANHCCRVS